MLEDDFTYVLRKALGGHQLTTENVAAQAGIAERAVLSFLRGTFCAETARKLASVTGLNSHAFAAHSTYEPRPLSLPQIRRLDLPFADGQVNAWFIEAGDERIIFDAGFDAVDLIRALEHIGGRPPDRAFITHGHRDHIGGLDYLLRSRIPVHSSGLSGTIPMKPGDAVFCGSLIVRAYDLSGHFVPSLGFSIEGLQAPAFVTGDALFAGSIGGCATPALYQQALRNLRMAIAELPENTILLPGHGPATTVGEERQSNPFL